MSPNRTVKGNRSLRHSAFVLVFRARNNNETPHASQRRSWNVSRDMRGTPHGGDAPVRTAAACTQAACTQAVQAVGSAMVLFVEAGLLGLRSFFTKRHQSSVTAPADLEPPKGLALGLGLGLGLALGFGLPKRSGWFGPVCEK